MRVILELNIEDQVVPADHLQELARKAVRAITGTEGPKVYPRLLVELGPNYLELPICEKKSFETATKV